MRLLHRRVIRKLGRGQTLDFFEAPLRRSVHVLTLHLFSVAARVSGSVGLCIAGFYSSTSGCQTQCPATRWLD
jgi:hypothetical protein